MSRQRKPLSLGALLAQSPALNDERRISGQLWQDVVGRRIAARSRPESIDRGTLFVTVASSSWAQELSLLSETILERLAERKKPVQALRFRVGHIDLKPKPPVIRIRRAPLPAALDQRLAQLGDTDLRECIAEAASYALGRSTH